MRNLGDKMRRRAKVVLSICARVSARAYLWLLLQQKAYKHKRPRAKSTFFTSAKMLGERARVSHATAAVVFARDSYDACFWGLVYFITPLFLYFSVQLQESKPR